MNVRKKFSIFNFQFSKKKKAEEKKIKKEDVKIDNEILKNLPPGVKIHKIEIGPKQILRFILTIILFFWGISAIAQLIVGDSVKRVSLSEALTVIKENKAEEITVMDNEVLIKVKDQENSCKTKK